MSRVILGKTFNLLTVISPDEKKYYFICRCECGNLKSVYKHNIIGGNVKSCGCLKKKPKSHGMTNHPLYSRWKGMKQRCRDAGADNYSRYGGKGIDVCEEWSNSFEKFLEDMGLPPNEEYTLDRINNSLGYNKSNCRWASPEEQARNKGDNRVLEFQGERKSLVEWSETMDISVQTLHSRLSRGWSVEETLTLPLNTRVSQFRSLKEF